MRPLHLMLYDETCHRGLVPGLSSIWFAGAHLYRALGRIDAWYAASTWADGLAWLADFQVHHPLASIQYWGHGNWGNVRLGDERLDTASLAPGAPHRPAFEQIRARLTGADALWWFRTCETFGTEAGHTFAREWSSFFGCRVAGHTHVIAWAQSGLHTLRPDQTPDWSVTEGLRNDEQRDTRARWSTFRSPNTISFLHSRIPEDF